MSDFSFVYSHTLTSKIAEISMKSFWLKRQNLMYNEKKSSNFNTMKKGKSFKNNFNLYVTIAFFSEKYEILTLKAKTKRGHILLQLNVIYTTNHVMILDSYSYIELPCITHL